MVMMLKPLQGSLMQMFSIYLHVKQRWFYMKPYRFMSCIYFMYH